MTNKANEEYKTSLSVQRTKLAVKQTNMAARRTLLSYISTSCVFISLAIAYLKLIDSEIDFLTIMLFVVGGFFLVFGLVDYIIVQRSLKDLVRDTILIEREKRNCEAKSNE